MSPPCQIRWPQVLWYEIYNGSSLSRNLGRPQDERVIRRYGWEPLYVRPKFTKFGSQRHCGSGDIMVLICLLISQNT